MKIKALQIALLLLSVTVFAQRQPLYGRVVFEGGPLQDILIVNLQSEKETRTDNLGNFMLAAQHGDVLVITDSRIRGQKHILTEDNLTEKPLLFTVELLSYELNEVVIERKAITSTILGLPMGREYTPAERRLHTASSVKPALYNTMTGGFIPFDPLINAITGKTRQLKRAVATEKKEYSISVLDGIYDEKEIIAEFGIPTDYVRGFIYYLVENKYLADALKQKNITRARSLIAELAPRYLALIADEK